MDSAEEEQSPLEYYKENGISVEMLKLVNNTLKLSDKKLTSLAKEKREEYVKEAISWASGQDQENRTYTEIYSFGNYSVGVGKPGKEAHPDYKGFRNYKTGIKGNNPHDMNPHILLNGKKVEKDLTFEDIFGEIERMKQDDIFGLELFGMLIYRMAFMIDHKVNENGNWRYSPPEEIIKLLEERIPKVSEKPIVPFLYFLDILGVNEDIKVTEGGHGVSKDYGRINTLLTFCHLVAVILGRKPLYKFAGQFSRPPSGMAPIQKTARGGIFKVFPLLSEEFND